MAVFSAGHNLAVADLAGYGSLDVARLHAEALVGRIGAKAAEQDTVLESVYALAPAIRHRGGSEAHVCALVQATEGVTLSTRRRVLPKGMCHRVL